MSLQIELVRECQLDVSKGEEKSESLPMNDSSLM